MSFADLGYSVVADQNPGGPDYHRRCRSRSCCGKLVGVLFVCFGIGLPPVAGQDLTDDQVLQILAQESPRDQAINRGLQFIRTQQQPDGSLSKNNATAMTSLALMAHLAAGVTPENPDHRAWMMRSLEFVLRQQDLTGYFGTRDGSRMYGHGIVTLMLAEMLGQTSDRLLEERLRLALERATQVTVAAALITKDSHNRGGWRYTPQARDSDLSLSGWQLMSLHATQQVGITVPQSVIDGAIKYTRSLTDREGRVGYQRPGEDHEALRGLGLLCLAIDEEPDPEAEVIGERIEKNPIEWKGDFFYYRIYYDAVGMSRALPERWQTYGKRLEKILLDHQAADGSWPRPPQNRDGENGPVYTTSMALLALTVNRHVLPAYQR